MWRPAGELLEAGVHLRRAVVLPGPVPGGGFEIDAADHRPRPYGVVGHLAGEVEGVVGDEHHVVIAVDGAEQRRIVFFPFARIGAGLELLTRNDARAELLRRILKCLGHDRIGRQRAFKNKKIAPLARHQILHQPIHAHGQARQRVHELARRRDSRRNASSAAVALKIRTSRPRTAAAKGLNASAGASTMKKWIPRASRACTTAGATSAGDVTLIRSRAKSVFNTRVSACASSMPTCAPAKGRSRLLSTRRP